MRSFQRVKYENYQQWKQKDVESIERLLKVGRV